MAWIYFIFVKCLVMKGVAQIFTLNCKKNKFIVHIYLTTVSRFPERKFDAFFIANGETSGFFAGCAQFVR